jgi:hypothetical protein
MKRLLLLILATMLAVICSFAETPAVHTVYILPMANGLDQYLADQLTRGHVVQVVADPKLADAIITDRLGEAFEQKMTQIHPRDDAEKKASTSSDIRPSFQSNGSRENFFLVDAKSRQILWSDYEKPARSLNREASRIAKKLGLVFHPVSPNTSKPASS